MYKNFSKNDLEYIEIISKNNNGIIPYVEVFYKHSILYSAKRCVSSFDRYEKSIGHEDADELISLLQEAIGHASSLFRYFYPSKSGVKEMKLLKEQRGIKLCNMFKLKNTPIEEIKKIRDAFEHYDERLDRYLLKIQAGYIFPSCLLKSHTLADKKNAYIFKLLDTEAQCLVLLGQKYFFKNVKDEVSNIYSQLQD